MKAWVAPTPYQRQLTNFPYIGLGNGTGKLVNRDSAATLEAGSVVRCRLEAGEVDWEIAPGRKVRGYGSNGARSRPRSKAGRPAGDRTHQRATRADGDSLARP